MGDEARPPEEARLPFRERWAWTLQMNRPMASPFIGLVCAVSIGGPLAVGIATGYPRAGSWAAVGSFFTDMAVFQPGHRFRARIVAGTGVLVAVGAFLGALCGIRGIAIFPLVALCTFAAGLLVELGPQAALIGVASVDLARVLRLVRRVGRRGAGRRRGHAARRPLHRPRWPWWPDGASPVTPIRPATRGATGWAWAREVAVTMRRSTRLRSIPFWHAVRLTAASLAGTVLFRVTNPDDGFWIPEAALFIMRPEPRLTRRRAVLRIMGSVAGAA